jgi:lipopolysaccharide/colanic/teichoic acid biosynthesis glycosyltransferase
MSYGHKIFYYFLRLAGIVLALGIAVFVWSGGPAATLSYFVLRPVNAVVVVFCVFLVAYFTDFSSFQFSIRGNALIKLGSLALKVAIMMVTASFAEFLLVFRNHMGRLIYLYFGIGLLVLFHLISLMPQRKPSLLATFQPEIAGLLTDLLAGRAQVFPLSDVKFDPVSPPERYTVVYDLRRMTQGEFTELIRIKLRGAQIRDVITFVESQLGRISLSFADPRWLLQSLQSINQVDRRVSDFFCYALSLILLLVLFPVALLAALLQQLESPGPLLYRQERLGLHGQPFTLLKFRTMVPDAEAETPRFSSRRDSRVTRIGRLMRRFRLDEVPQLFNILRREMLLIGPRPEREIFVRQLEKAIPFYRLRLEVKPGVTGWAQVSMLYAGDDVNEHSVKLEYDLYYIKNRWLLLDLFILLKTVKTAIWGRGV